MPSYQIPLEDSGERVTFTTDLFLTFELEHRGQQLDTRIARWLPLPRYRALVIVPGDEDPHIIDLQLRLLSPLPRIYVNGERLDVGRRFPGWARVARWSLLLQVVGSLLVSGYVAALLGLLALIVINHAAYGLRDDGLARLAGLSAAVIAWAVGLFQAGLWWLF